MHWNEISMLPNIAVRRLYILQMKILHDIDSLVPNVIWDDNVVCSYYEQLCKMGNYV